jgi:hypothetical protein
VSTTDPTIQHRLAIRELAFRYARAADRRDYEAFREIFTPDGRIIGYLGDPETQEPIYQMIGHDVICQNMSALEQYETTFHFVGNQLVEIDGDAAKGETYCTAHHVYTEEGVRMSYTMFVRYQDRFARTDGVWQFSERCLLIDFTQRTPVADAPPSA